MTGWIKRIPALLALSLCVAVLAGCDDKKDAKEKASDKTAVAKADDKKKEEVAGHGWWCDEHGVQEAECSMCSAKVAKACKAKGDWCEKHERAKSQCFLCDPKLKDKFAAQYRAKFGKDAPEPDGQKEDKKDDK